MSDTPNPQLRHEPTLAAAAEGLRPDIASKIGRRRVIHLAKHCRQGNGNVHVAVDLACLQAEAGYDVIYASEGGTYVDMLERHGVEHVSLAQDQRSPSTMALSLLKLVRLCRSRKTEILHAHMMAGAALGWAAAKLTSAKLVTTVHNSFDKHSRLMRFGDVVVSVSDAEKRHLVERGFDEKRIIAIWNAPNQSPREDFMQNEHAIELTSPNILAVCGLHRRKGVFDLINAFAEVAVEFPDWRLYIAGDGPDRAALEALCKDVGQGGQIVFLGYVKAPKKLFETADIFVLPSYADPGSLTIGEARAAGCAIIATTVGGTPEMLEFGRAGRLVAPGSPQQLAVELRRLMADSGERERLGASARAGSEIFDAPRLLTAYARAYDFALQSSGQ